MDDTLLLWVDVETTGLDPSHGAILEIGMRWTDTRLDRLDGGFSTPVAYAGPVDGFIERMHGPNGLLAACARPGAPTSDEAARLARAYVASRLSDGVRVLAAGASVRFDRDWLDTRMPGVLSGVHHRSLDVSALDEAARMWAPLTWAARPERTTDHRVDSRLDDELRLAAYYRDAFRGGGVCGLGCGACWPAWAVGSSPPRAARCGCGCSCSARPSPWPRTWWPCGGSPRTGRGRSSVSCSSPWRACSCSGAAGVACMRCAPPATRTGSPTRIGRGSPSVRPGTGRVAAEPAAQSFEPADLLLEFADAFPSVLDGQGDVVLVPGAAQERHVGAVGQFAPFVLASRPLVVAQRGRVVRVPAEPLGLLGFGALVDGLADRGGAQRVRLYFVKSVFRV
ncbi:hypothetical protein [Bifidobacterium catenulatum]|uniref:hypothetical protein n=2 Tax=Bifidobacterium TaxID=1678 RepID=UPI0023EDDF61|nr:hypothetical protein [Bifidobacterium catenulatum]MDF4085445.1 hypothetical protein [Bifidobacterium catenulatum]MDF4093432.1 hypothetical protein [Bifidobacterium catenulatum]